MSGSLPLGALVHYAGPPFQVGRIMRQRCVWCGALIHEIFGDVVEVNMTMMFPPGSYVAVVGQQAQLVGMIEAGDVPSQACSYLDPTLTGLRT